MTGVAMLIIFVITLCFALFPRAAPTVARGVIIIVIALCLGALMLIVWMFHVHYETEARLKVYNYCTKGQPTYNEAKCLEHYEYYRNTYQRRK